MDLFAGTAMYYDEYRPGVPQDVIARVLQPVATPITLLDLGTGTGRITEQFAPYFNDIIGVEPDDAMVAFARQRLERFHARVIRATAEDAHLPDGWQASLVIICRAFHWMNRPLVIRKLESIVAPDGVIAIVSDGSFWDVQDEWGPVVKQVIQHYAGPERRTIMGNYKPPREYFAENFESTTFTHITKHTIPVVRQWNADQIIGYLYSTSFASHAVLGDKAEAFEKTVRAELAGLSPNDVFVEHNAFDVLLAMRDRH